MPLIYACGGFALWMVLGCMILAFIDDETQSLLKWADACPLGIGSVIVCWPIVAWVWYFPKEIRR